MDAMRPFLVLALLLPLGAGAGEELAAGFESITEKDVLVHVTELAAPQLEGRDSPSEGLTRAGDYIISRLKAAGVEPGGPDQGFRMPYTRHFAAPVPARCALMLELEGGETVSFALEEDFVPLPGCPGEGHGPLSFHGFGITGSEERRYDDLKGRNCKGEVVMVLESEPRHKKLFEGPEITAAGDVYAKIRTLEERGAAGVLVVRRPPAEEPKGADGKPLAPAALGYRYTWADWNTGAPDVKEAAHGTTVEIPVLEVSAAAATRILGEDVLELAANIEKTGKPLRREPKERKVTLSAEFAPQDVPLDNIVGLVRGTDPAVAGEYVVLGAHYDHIGVDGWGRIGCGADDNASGSAGLLELAEGFALSRPRRSLLFAWFSAEEDGLIGSRSFCDNPPVPREALIAMLNMDMIGRCEEGEVVVVGTHLNPGFEDVLKEAKKLRATQIKKVVTNKGIDLWGRSDQAPFHDLGIPALFFTEGEIDADNPDYHTYRDTIDRLSIPKVTRTTRLVYNTAWLIANAPERPPRPR